MAIDAQLRPEINIGGLPMFGFPSSTSHQDYNNGGSCGFNYNVLSLGHSRKRQRLDREQLMYMQQLQSQQQTGHRNLCSVSDIRDGEKESDQKDRDFPAGLDRHNQEIDQYLTLQGERLKWLLKELRQHHEAILLRKIGLRAQSLIQEKDQEIARASKKTAEIQSLLMKLEAESQAWRRVAQENEAVVVSLNNALGQLKDRDQEEDAESCCDETGDRGAEVGTGTGESREIMVEEKMMMMMMCRACNYGEACVLFLPCRHLCSCKSCDVFLERCPVCGTAKKASIEALFL